MDVEKNFGSHQVPLGVKLICSICIWFPLLISFFTLWSFPTLTVIYNLLISLYLILSFLSTYGTCFTTFVKQRQIIFRFFPSAQWLKMKDAFLNHRHEASTIADILHLVVVPIYQEDPSIVEKTIESLAEQQVSMLVALALEERERNSETKYNAILEKYEGRFVKIVKTIHPTGLKDEVAGKASNSDYAARQLTDYYQEHLRESYPHAMVTSCDCDSIWCENYFLYLNYLSTKNQLDQFDRIVYAPNITSLKHFSSNHFLSNWMSMARTIGIHGHFRRFGFLRCFTSEYHIPLNLMQAIEFWDTDIVHEDVHMSNKLAMLAGHTVLFEQTFLPCDNQTPTNPNSCWDSLRLLWRQSLRWNLFLNELYYLFHQYLLTRRDIQRYEHFRIDSTKVLRQLATTYEYLFLFFVSPLPNQVFWLVYSHLFDHQPYDYLVFPWLDYIQTTFLLSQTLLTIVFAVLIFDMHDERTNGQAYRWPKQILFVLGFTIFPYLCIVFQTCNMVVAWISTLTESQAHTESAPKLHGDSKQA